MHIKVETIIYLGSQHNCLTPKYTLKPYLIFNVNLYTLIEEQIKNPEVYV